jgi:hypothetical protein
MTNAFQPRRKLLRVDQLKVDGVDNYKANVNFSKPHACKQLLCRN